MLEITLPITIAIKPRNKKGRGKVDELIHLVQEYVFGVKEVNVDDVRLVAHWNRRVPRKDTFAPKTSMFEHDNWLELHEKNVHLASIIEFEGVIYSPMRGIGEDEDFVLSAENFELAALDEKRVSPTSSSAYDRKVLLGYTKYLKEDAVPYSIGKNELSNSDVERADKLFENSIREIDNSLSPYIVVNGMVYIESPVPIISIRNFKGMFLQI